MFLAEDTRLHRKVALKLLHDVAGAEDRLARFEREAGLTAPLEHPGICTMYEAGIGRGRPFIAMQHLEGEALGLRIDTTKASVSSAPARTTRASRR